jgi:hypothetical protein
VSGFSVALFIVTVIIVVWAIGFRFIYYPTVRAVNQKYPLFAARDAFVSLKLQGKFNGDPDLYDFLIGVCNRLIIHTKALNFWTFVVSLSRVEEDWELIKDYRVRLQKAPREVRDAEEVLWNAVRKILYDNSTVLRLVLHITRLRCLLERAPHPVRESQMVWPVRQYERINEFRHA